MNFGHLPDKYSIYESAAITILPVPFDLTSTWIKGADKGPEAIIEASSHLELFDCITHSEVYRNGIATLLELTAESPIQLFNEVSHKVSQLLKDRKFVVTLGGNHSVSIGSIYAHIKAFEDLTILHFDAHADSREIYEGSEYNHACVVSRILDMTENIISIGVRSMDISEAIDRKHHTIYAHKMIDTDIWIQDILEKSSENVYITFDLDVLDPSIMPSTGTPEPGGMTWNQIMKAFCELSNHKKIRGFDVVELCPIKEFHAPDFLAAKLVYNLLSLIFHRP